MVEALLPTPVASVPPAVGHCGDSLPPSASQPNLSKTASAAAVAAAAAAAVAAVAVALERVVVVVVVAVIAVAVATAVAAASAAMGRPAAGGGAGLGACCYTWGWGAYGQLGLGRRSAADAVAGATRPSSPWTITTPVAAPPSRCPWSRRLRLPAHRHGRAGGGAADGAAELLPAPAAVLPATTRQQQ